MSIQRHIAVLLFIVYVKIFAEAVWLPEIKESITKDPLYLIELNVILPFEKLIQLPEEKRKLLSFWSPDMHSVFPENPSSGCPGLIIADSTRSFSQSFHKSYLKFRRLRI